MTSLILDEAPQKTSQVIYSPEALALVDLEKVPKHIAIIMDGNRRWAKQQGMPPMMGHWKGAETLRHIVRAASELGVRALTVYSFSTENWLRPKEEVEALMHLFEVYLSQQRESMVEEGVCLQTIGDVSLLPKTVREELALSKSATEHCKKIDLVLAMNYGGRDDIRRAFIRMAEDIEKGILLTSEITEERISQHLDTAPWPDPDLLIRPSGEHRQSNFLLWQLCYSEFYYTSVCWPDFDETDLLETVLEYQRRQRRFGGS